MLRSSWAALDPLWASSFQSSSVCQTNYSELPFGLRLLCSCCSPAWLRWEQAGEPSCPDSHRTVGELLALSFWEDSAFLDQMAAWIPSVRPACCPCPTHTCARAHTHTLRAHTQCTWAIATGQLFSRVLSTSLSRDPLLLAHGASIWQRTLRAC